MEMAEKMSLSDVLSDEPEQTGEVSQPDPVERAVAAQEQNQESKQEEPQDAPPEQERPKSTRRRHREKEEAAREAGKSPKEEAKAEEPKAEEPPKEPPKEAAPATSPPPQDLTEKEKAFLAAAQTERRKRQELEQRLAALEKAPQEEKKGFWDDPETAVKQLEERIQGVATSTRLNTAEMIARQRHPDFDDKIAVFGQLVQETPGLMQKWLSSPDPAEFAYMTGKNYQEIQKVGSIDALIKQREAEVEARVKAQMEAEYKKRAEQAASERAALPSSLSDARGTQVNKQVWSGPSTLEDILK